MRTSLSVCKEQYGSQKTEVEIKSFEGRVGENGRNVRLEVSRACKSKGLYRVGGRRRFGDSYSRNGNRKEG